MKKFIPKLLLLIGMAVAIASCSKKDQAAPTAGIVGKWLIVADTLRVYDSTGNLFRN